MWLWRGIAIVAWSQEWVVDRNIAYSDPTSLRASLTSFTMGGGRDLNPAYIGTFEPAGWWNGAQFPGSIAGLTVHRQAIDLHAANCLFQELSTGENRIGTCPAYASAPETVPGLVWFNDFLNTRCVCLFSPSNVCEGWRSLNVQTETWRHTKQKIRLTIKCSSDSSKRLMTVA